MEMMQSYLSLTPWERRSYSGLPEALTRNLLAHCRALGVQACSAVSRNIYAATALVKGLSPQTFLKIIPTGEERAALASLPLTVLDLTEEQEKTFSLWGIQTLGMLAELPENELISRMGQSGKHLHQLSRGEMSHSFQPSEPAFVLEERLELDTPVELLDSLFFAVNECWISLFCAQSHACLPWHLLP